uniref:Uncharacterized protein n=1 Tax=Takifugu rubripes TaxID=31033 RepID=A0A674P5U8_TAKRU
MAATPPPLGTPPGLPAPSQERVKTGRRDSEKQPERDGEISHLFVRNNRFEGAQTHEPSFLKIVLIIYYFRTQDFFLLSYRLKRAWHRKSGRRSTESS